jgi:hypothetical protein
LLFSGFFVIYLILSSHSHLFVSLPILHSHLVRCLFPSLSLLFPLFINVFLSLFFLSFIVSLFPSHILFVVYLFRFTCSPLLKMYCLILPSFYTSISTFFRHLFIQSSFSIYLLMLPFLCTFSSVSPILRLLFCFHTCHCSLTSSYPSLFVAFYEPDTARRASSDMHSNDCCFLNRCMFSYCWINSMSCMRDRSYINTRRDRQLSVLSHVQHVTVRGHHELRNFYRFCVERGIGEDKKMGFVF